MGFRLLAVFCGALLSASTIWASTNVLEAQKILNQLGYKAGPSDGVVGKKTINAIANYYTDQGSTFDGTIDSSELENLKATLKSKNLSLKIRAENLGITLSGHYIDKTLKESSGKYLLPSNSWFRGKINSDRGVFYKAGSAWGDWDSDGLLDYIGLGMGHRCGTGGTSGNSVVKEGREGCASFQTALWVPFIPFKVIKQEKRFEKLNVNKIFDFDGDRNIGYAANAARAIIEDFNGDGIDDIYPTNAQVQNIKGKFSYKGPNHILISDGQGKWKQSYHIGYLTDKKRKIYMGFSHGADAGDIDNDGDIDILTTEFAGVVCHYNDGNGNFNAKLCSNVNGSSMTTADFNNDGNLDMVVSADHYNPVYAKYSSQKYSNPKRQRTVLLLGDGKGTFYIKQKLEPLMDGKFMFSTVPEMTAFDFDNDGDADIISSVVGPNYSGSAWIAYENIGGQLRLADHNIFLKPLPEWQNPKVWGSMVKDEFRHPWNSYCHKSLLIDINDDGLMDALCSADVQRPKSPNLVLLNKGDMKFDILKPDEVTGWVRWLK